MPGLSFLLFVTNSLMGHIRLRPDPERAVLLHDPHMVQLFRHAVEQDRARVLTDKTVWPCARRLIEGDVPESITDALDLVRIERDLHRRGERRKHLPYKPFPPLLLLTILGTDHWNVKPFCVGWTMAVSEHRMIPVRTCFSDSKAGSSERSQCRTEEPGKCLFIQADGNQR